MAVPKKKVSLAKRRIRLSSHYNSTAQYLSRISYMSNKIRKLLVGKERFSVGI
ncbi:MAG: hypothetical protein ACKESC_01710 [Candidatus Hodgkinia cicadicola]